MMMQPSTYVPMNGVTQSISDWAMDYGIPVSVILSRIHKGMDPEEAITKPMPVARGQRLPASRIRQAGKVISATDELAHEGQTMTVAQWADAYTMPVTLVVGRLRCGWSTHRALTQPVPVTSQRRARG